MWTASDLLNLYLLVTVYAMDPMTAGLVFLVGLAANAFADLGVGLWLARRPRDAAMLAGTGLVAASLALPPSVLLAPAGAWAVMAATLVFRIAYAGCDVPHNALLTRLGDVPHRAVALSRGRTIGTALASVLAAATVGGPLGVAPLLWGLAGGSLVIGTTMVPLLIAFPLPAAGPGQASEGGLPWRFLAASVIGIVALAALAKAILHLPAEWHGTQSGTAILVWLILGRTLSALVPMRLATAARGLMLLAVAFVAASVVAVGLVWSAGPVMIVLLGLVMGVTNLIGWAMLPLLSVSPRGYGVYAMASKLALGASGLALAGGLGGIPTFTPFEYRGFCLAIGAACLLTAALFLPWLTARQRHAFSVR